MLSEKCYPANSIIGQFIPDVSVATGFLDRESVDNNASVIFAQYRN